MLKCFSVKNRLLLLFSALCVLALGKAPAHAQVSVIVSVADQKMAVFRDNAIVAQYPVSTSKFGVGDRSQSYETPLGVFAVAAKIGAGAPEGAVFKGRRPTGEVVRVNAPGRDAIVTRILQLRGLTEGAAQALDRGIYIHGTPAEALIGHPVSYGCIRMRSRDVVRLFDETTVGTRIAIVKTPLRDILARVAVQHAAQGPALAAN